MTYDVCRRLTALEARAFSLQHTIELLAGQDLQEIVFGREDGEEEAEEEEAEEGASFISEPDEETLKSRGPDAQVHMHRSTCIGPHAQVLKSLARRNSRELAARQFIPPGVGLLQGGNEDVHVEAGVKDEVVAFGVNDEDVDEALFRMLELRASREAQGGSEDGGSEEQVEKFSAG